MSLTKEESVGYWCEQTSLAFRARLESLMSDMGLGGIESILLGFLEVRRSALSKQKRGCPINMGRPFF